MRVMKLLVLMLLLSNGTSLAFGFEEALALWLHEVNAEIYARGEPLSPELHQIAVELGIARIDDIRVLVVDAVPVPTHRPTLYREGERRGLWGPGIAGNAQVFGHGVAVTQEVLDDKGKMAHELMHIRQIERFGAVEDFVVEYLRQIAEYGYANAPLEVEAFEQNARYGSGK